jgi:hypothetical protein
VFTLANGMKCDGKWKNDKMNGPGRVYLGQWRRKGRYMSGSKQGWQRSVHTDAKWHSKVAAYKWCDHWNTGSYDASSSSALALRLGHRAYSMDIFFCFSCQSVTTHHP